MKKTFIKDTLIKNALGAEYYQNVTLYASWTKTSEETVKEIQSKYKIDTKRLDYMVSPCEFVIEKFSSAWNLKAYGKENAILEIGYPRNDFITNATSRKNMV